MYTHLTRNLCSIQHIVLEVMFKVIDIFMKLLKNELVFHGINKHVVPLGVSGNIMNISNTFFFYGGPLRPLYWGDWFFTKNPCAGDF